jgi:hypothetical protein
VVGIHIISEGEIYSFVINIIVGVVLLKAEQIYLNEVSEEGSFTK